MALGYRPRKGFMTGIWEWFADVVHSRIEEGRARLAGQQF